MQRDDTPMTRTDPKNVNYVEEASRIFLRAPFIKNLGIKPVHFEPGKCETVLVIEPSHLQQDGFIHAGVQATMADHSAGAAAFTLVAEKEFVLTAEFKINFLRAAKGDRLRCVATVLKPGNHLSVVESEVFCQSGDNQKLVSKATVTLAVLQR